MIDEEQVKNIVKKVLDEEHLHNFIKIFEKEHNLFRGSHDKIGLPEALNIPQKIVEQVAEKTDPIESDKIADGAIVNKKLYDECVSANKIADEAIEEAKIAGLAVSEEKIAVNAVTATKINVVGLDGESGRICVVDAVDADEITAGINAHALTLIEAGKILISGETDLSDWRHGVDATLIDGGKIYTQSITAAQILAGTIGADKINVGDFICLPSDENLVGYWSFDEGSGVLAIDGSGNGNNGTLNNMTEADWVDGKVGKCLEFDGVNDYVGIPNAASLRFGTGDFSIGTWIKAGINVTAHRGIYCKGTGMEATNFAFYLSSGSGVLRFLNGGISILDGTTALNDNKLHYVQAIRSGNSLSFYVDSVLDATTPTGMTGVDLSTTAIVTIGWRDATRFFIGLIDEVRIYKRALTASEIKALYLYPAGNKYRVISGVQIADDTITAAKIVAGTITADEIFAGTITADKLVLNQRSYWYSTPGTTTGSNNDAEKNTLSDTYVKIKETKLNEATGKMRIYFELKALDAGVDVFARIYKNGVAIGTERSTQSDTYIPYSEDLGGLIGFSANDLIQIYAYRTGSTRAYVRNFRLQYTRAVSVIAGQQLSSPLPTISQAIFSVTNQDP